MLVLPSFMSVTHNLSLSSYSEISAFYICRIVKMKSHLKSWWMSSKSRAIDWWGAILLAEWLLSGLGSWLSRLSLVNLPYWALLLAARHVWSEVNDFNRLPQPETGLWLVVVVGWCSSPALVQTQTPDTALSTRRCQQQQQQGASLGLSAESVHQAFQD